MKLFLGVCFTAAALAEAAAATPATAKLRAVPTPVALWTFQEPTGAPRISTGGNAYALIDGNASAPIPRVAGGVLGPYSAYFPGLGHSQNNSQRLYAPRETVPALASGIAGPDAVVTLVTWMYRSVADANRSGEGMPVGVWDEYGKARQYAIFTDLGVCHGSPTYTNGLAAHISPVGGPTPGRMFCYTAACDPRPLPAAAWHCLANVYNGTAITAYLNATEQSNGSWDPFELQGGIYSPEAHGAFGAEFGVGLNRVNHTVGGPPVWSNAFIGRLGGVAVWADALSAEQVAAVCGAGEGFEDVRAAGEAAGWTFNVPT